jgi:altronate dehydratase
VIDEIETLEEAGQRLYEHAIHVANGKMTKAEVLKFDERMQIMIKGPII